MSGGEAGPFGVGQVLRTRLFSRDPKLSGISVSHPGDEPRVLCCSAFFAITSQARVRCANAEEFGEHPCPGAATARLAGLMAGGSGR